MGVRGLGSGVGGIHVWKFSGYVKNKVLTTHKLKVVSFGTI